MILIKIGGGTEINLDGIAEDIRKLKEGVVIVHGANALRKEIAGKLGIEIRTITSVAGISSVHSDETLIELMMMTYAGLANKQIVRRLQESGVNSIGLTGIDGALIKGYRNKGIRALVSGKKKVIRDLSAKPYHVNIELLETLIVNGYTPVITVPILDENSIAVNTDNDEIVSLLAQSMEFSDVIFLVEAQGLLDNPEDPRSLIETLDPKNINAKHFRGRMGRKIVAIKKISDNSCSNIHISDGRIENPITYVLSGNRCTRVAISR